MPSKAAKDPSPIAVDLHLLRSYLLPILCCLLVFAAQSGPQEPQHPWDYGNAHGPSHWGDLKPEYAECKTGHHESPIDIRNPRPADLPPIQFDYKPSPLHIINNGHSIQINYAPGSFISVGGKRYELKQFHFHRPSEEEINGKRYEMTIHLVHADEQGKTAVVAVLLEKGRSEPLIHELWNHLPKEEDKELILNDVQIDATKLLPDDRGYYTFDGSLTTPPCTEGVTWFVLKHPVSVSEAEIEEFAKEYKNNARPIQPLYDRVVLESK
jgi:carbonic anhydrase